MAANTIPSALSSISSIRWSGHGDNAEPDPEKVHLTTRTPQDAAADAVKDESRKGYDLMVIGMENSIEADGGFAPKVTKLAEGFEGPLMMLVHSGGKARLLSGLAAARGARLVASPRHADGVLVTGVVTRNMAVPLEKTLDAVPEPRVVVACGDCDV